MPIYSIKCPGCERRDTMFRKVAERDETPNCPCGWQMRRVLEAPFIQPVTFEPFESPVTPGKMIETRQQLHEELVSHDCFLNEPGVRKDIEKRKEELKKQDEAFLDAKVDEIVRDLNVAGKLEITENAT